MSSLRASRPSPQRMEPCEHLAPFLKPLHMLSPYRLYRHAYIGPAPYTIFSEVAHTSSVPGNAVWGRFLSQEQRAARACRWPPVQPEGLSMHLAEAVVHCLLLLTACWDCCADRKGAPCRQLSPCPVAWHLQGPPRCTGGPPTLGACLRAAAPRRCTAMEAAPRLPWACQLPLSPAL